MNITYSHANKDSFQQLENFLEASVDVELDLLLRWSFVNNPF